jgi:hypothetical protein
MAIVRFLSLVLIVVALMLLGADVVSSLEKGDEPIVRSLSQILLLLGFDANQWFERELLPAFANACIAVFSLPGWVVLGIPAAALGLTSIGRHASRPPPSPPPVERW